MRRAAETSPRLGRLGNVSGALLMGGASSRMGRDKSRLERDGQAWSTQTARLLDGLFEQVLLVGGNPETAAPGTRIRDGAGPACALRGLVAAFDAAATERVVVVATDLPLLEADLILALTAWPEADALVPVDARGDQPLCAIYRPEACLDAARDALAANRLSLSAFLDAVETRRVTLDQLGFGECGSGWLTNVNTQDDLERLEAR